MLLLLLGSASAFALQEISCNGLDIVDTVPSNGATDVPVDVRVAVVFGEGGCVPALGTEVTLADADGTAIPVALGPGSDDPDGTWLIELVTDEAFVPETSYVVTMTPPFSGEVSQMGFTTGTGTVVGLTGTPSLRVEETRWESESERSWGGLVSLDLAIEPAEDPDGLSVVQVKDADRDDHGVQSFRVPASGAKHVTVSWIDGRRPDEVCPQVRQIDGKGVATEWSEPACADVPGCSTASGPPALGLALLGMLTAAARRRARPGPGIPQSPASETHP